MEAKTNRQKQAAKTKEKIFQSAMRLFEKLSYENVTIHDIAENAQVSVGAFYHHFKTKESILNEGYRMFDEQLEQAWSSGHPESTMEALHFLIDHQMHSMESMGHLAAGQYFKNQLTNEDKYILDKNRFFYKTLYTVVQKGISDGVLVSSVSAITDDIFSSCRGIIYDWCLNSGAYPLREKGGRILSMALNYYSAS